MTNEQEAVRLINTFDQLKAAGGGVALVVSMGGSRDTYVDGWLVLRLNARGESLVTDKDAAWYHHKRKHFSMPLGRDVPFAERRRLAFEEARAWVAEQGWYTGEWKRNAIGDFVPADVQKRFPIKRRK
jgi:hypothetical protein